MEKDNQVNDKIKLRDLLANKYEAEGLEGKYNAALRKKVLFIIILIGVLSVVFVVALSVGSVQIPFMETLRVIGHSLFPSLIDGPHEEYYEDIIILSRLPRIMLTILTGISLAAAGQVMQGILRNPLVSPFTLGVSTAASFGAAMSIVFGAAIFGSFYYGSITIGDTVMSNSNLINVIFAFIFGLSSIVLVLLLTRNRYVSKSTVILAGVVISYLFQAGLSFTKYISDDDALREITLWLMGGMWNATMGAVLLLIPIVIVCFIYLEKISVDINTLSSGEDVATNLGIDVKKLRTRGLLVSTFMTSACLAFTGVIGFIGLMAPHICRMIIGNDSRFVLPAAALFGAIILTLSDMFARIVMSPTELPVGIIMYLIGGIFFIWLITRKGWVDRS